MKNELQELRRSAVVSTYGPGSVVDFRAGGGAVSGIAAGLEEWDRSFPPAGLAHPQVIRETRLQKKLGVKGFRTPPVTVERGKDDEPDTRRLVAVRFPKWLQCPSCDIIKPERRWKYDPGKAYRYCPTCTEKAHGDSKVFVIPVRFVMACKHGHVDEFPWDWWVGHKPGCSVAKRENTDRHPGLVLRSERPGLAGLILSCPKCGARRSMDGVFSKKTWERGPKCRGHRPWLADGNENCGKEQYAVQRGASNLYFAVTESALSIPPWSDRLQEVLGDWWSSLTNLDDLSKLEEYIGFLAKGDLESVLKELEMSPAELAEAIRARLTSYGQLRTDDLRPAEYRQFVTEPGRSRTPDIDFETRREAVAAEIAPWISRVVRAVRLREVRAIKGFTRINPPGDPDSPEVARLSKKPLEWLPAIEVRGEGIFLALNEERLSSWENRARRRGARFRVRNAAPDRLERTVRRRREATPGDHPTLHALPHPRARSDASAYPRMRLLLGISPGEDLCRYWRGADGGTSHLYRDPRLRWDAWRARTSGEGGAHCRYPPTCNRCDRMVLFGPALHHRHDGSREKLLPFGVPRLLSCPGDIV